MRIERIIVAHVRNSSPVFRRLIRWAHDFFSHSNHEWN